jgi:beta-lactam-binding protein with PASTA domain
MNLGGSMKRRRGGVKQPVRSSSEAGGGRRFFTWFLVALAVIAVGSGSGFLYATHVLFPVEPVEIVDVIPVPDLRGLTPAEARLRLEQAGLVAGKVDSIRHPRVAAGIVVGQSPLALQVARPGGEVEISVSLGAERRPVPDVRRLREDRALTLLESSGFAVRVDSIQADAPLGQVVDTDPSPGTRVTLPARIRMTVSLGPPLVVLPNLVGMSEAEAREALSELGLLVGEVEIRTRFGFTSGDVLETFPEAGAEVPRGGAVRLVIRRRGFFDESSVNSGAPAGATSGGREL